MSKFELAPPFPLHQVPAVEDLKEADASGELGDHEMLSMWLAVFDKRSVETAKSYRLQSAKFRLFLAVTHPDWPKNSLLRLAREKDVLAYEDALTEDPIERQRIDLLPTVEDSEDADMAALMGRKQVKKMAKPKCPPKNPVVLTPEELVRYGRKTQPFQYGLAKQTINVALQTLHSMYKFFRDPQENLLTPYVAFNPVKRPLEFASRQTVQTNRLIPNDGLRALSQYLDAEIQKAHDAESPSKLALRVAYRQKALFSVLFGLWLRREEICKLKFKHVKFEIDQGWVVTVIRKGGKEQVLVVPDDVIRALRKCRVAFGLLEDWNEFDGEPLILPLRKRKQSGATKHLTTTALHLEIQKITNGAANYLYVNGVLPDLTEFSRFQLFETLQASSLHWFRHSGVTEAVNTGKMELEEASKHAGHSSVAVTSQMYLHADKKKTRAGLNSLFVDLQAPAAPRTPASLPPGETP